MIEIDEALNKTMNELRELFASGKSNAEAVEFLRSNRFHQYKIDVVPMKESHRDTYWVYATRDDRKPDTSMLDNDLVYTPYMSEELERTVFTAAELAKFLDVPFDHPLIEETPWMKSLLKVN